jgi:hypothetical protein
MSSLKKFMNAAAGTAAASASSELYVEDVFSTYLYTGNGSSQTITNGIALGGFGLGTSTEFDGVSDYLSRSSDLVGNSDGKTFTFSAWLYSNLVSSGGRIVMGDATGGFNRFGITWNSSDTIALYGANSSGTTVLSVTIPASGVVGPMNTFTHLLISVDLTNVSNRYVYINDQLVTATWNTYTNSDIDFTLDAGWFIGSNTGGGSYFDGRLAHLYLDYTYRDLSVASNRRYFIDANGGSTAPSTLSALSPILYLPMTEDYTIGKNLGTGGDFTANGSPTIVQSGTEYQVGYGAGGLVWTKNRDTNGYYHVLQDTVQGGGKYLSSNVANSAAVLSPASTFSSNGYSINTSGAYFNASSKTYVSWTFRKAPKFFDIVTYTGNGTDRDIAHGLGSDPGMIIIKRTDSSESWIVYHRSLEGTGTNWSKLELESAGAEYGGTRLWGSGTGQDHTSTTFHVSSYASVNASGGTFVAYLFAHNDGDGEFGESGDQDIIKCGSYEGTGTAPYPEIDLGWEPQYLLVKNADYAQVWNIIDVMRGWIVDGYDKGLFANSSNAEDTVQSFGHPTPTGFKVGGSEASLINRAGDTYIYIAIRRPMKTPTSGSEVFTPVARTVSTSTLVNVGHVVDLNIQKLRTSSDPAIFQDRLRGVPLGLASSSTGAEDAGYATISSLATNIGFVEGSYTNGQSVVYQNFKRAPGFFDVVAYTGTGSATTINHNLGVAPELIIAKKRSSTGNGWGVYAASVGNNKAAQLNYNGGFSTSGQWANTTPTDSIFSIGAGFDVNDSGSTYIAYLFASCPGVSKVGSYTGNGTSQNIDCGFSTGARFVLIKVRDAAGDWYVWDTARGIVTGNDPFLELNTTNAEDSSYDSVDPYSAGFSVNQDSGTNINVINSTYIFLAIS